MPEAQVKPQQPPTGTISIGSGVSISIGTASIPMNQPTISPNKLEETLDKAARDHSFPLPEEDNHG